jgi:hypothetical protein
MDNIQNCDSYIIVKTASDMEFIFGLPLVRFGYTRMWQRTSNKPSQCEVRQTETGSYCYLPCGENIHVANIIHGHYDKMGNNEAFKVIRLMEKET